MAVAAGLAGLLVWRIQTPVQPAAPRLAMILPLQQTQGGWLVDVQPDGRITAVAQGNVSHAADRDFELWALADHATRPVPLGLLPVGAGRADLRPGNLPAQNFKLLVSLEPKGGSPTGLPTGPVMFGGDVIRPPG
jgi:anti-sigma-K factor RskA